MPDRKPLTDAISTALQAFTTTPPAAFVEVAIAAPSDGKPVTADTVEKEVRQKAAAAYSGLTLTGLHVELRGIDPGVETRFIVYGVYRR